MERILEDQAVGFWGAFDMAEAWLGDPLVCIRVKMVVLKSLNWPTLPENYFQQKSFHGMREK